MTIEIILQPTTLVGISNSSVTIRVKNFPPSTTHVIVSFLV